jgi:hypothetical protein
MPKLSTYPARQLNKVMGVDVFGNVGIQNVSVIGSTASNSSSKLVQPSMELSQYPNLTLTQLAGIDASGNVGLQLASAFQGGITGPNDAFPVDSGIFNVQSYGATGNGVTDDTAAINACINAVPQWGATSWPFTSYIVYFPAGTYLVSAPLQWSTAYSQLTLYGQSQGSVTIKLKDGSSGFSSPSSPQGVIIMQDSNFATAFDNNVENLTIDVGNNAGANGIDYLTNNIGVIRNVTIQTSHPAAIGINCNSTNKPCGPCLFTNVTITGAFAYGIGVAAISGQTGWPNYHICMETVTINGTTSYGIYMGQTTMSFHNLTITTNGGYGIANITQPIIFFLDQANEGLITGINGTISGTGTAALNNTATINFKNVNSVGFNGGGTVSLDGVFHGASQVATASWALTPQTAPASVTTPASQWVNVKAKQYPADSTAEFQAAFSQNTSVIYIPTGLYQISDVITVNDNIDRIEGMGSVLYTVGMESGAVACFKTNSTRTKNFEIKRLNAQPRTGSALALVDWFSQSSASLSMSDCGGYIAAFQQETSAGKVFAENISMPHIFCNSSSPVFVRSINTEIASTMMYASTTPLWVLGLKTEQGGACIQATSGANVEIVGGYYFPSASVSTPGPNLISVDSRIAFSGAEDADTLNAGYQEWADIEISGTHYIINPSAFPIRDPQNSVMTAWFTTDNLPPTAVNVNSSLPVITGSHVGSGQTLTTSNGTWNLPGVTEGSPNPTSFTYRWFKDGVAIGGATSSTYVVQAGDVGHNITSGVKAVNNIGSSSEAVSGNFNITATYVGPGNVIGSALTWYGLRAYNAAWVSGTNKSVTLRRDSDNTTADISFLSDGTINISSASAFCSGANCFVAKMYDQSGNGHDVSQATTTKQPKFVFNFSQGGTYPAVNFDTNLKGLSGAYTQVAAQPNTTSIVAYGNAAPGATDDWLLLAGAGLANELGPNNASTWYLYNGGGAGLVVTPAAASGSFHAMQAVFNSTGSAYNVDGTDTTGVTLGNNDPTASSSIAIGAYAPIGTTASGYLLEIGIWGSGFTATNRSSMHTNQSNFWGTP